MHVVITDLFREHSRHMVGSPKEIEKWLTGLFPPAMFLGVNDLDGVIRTINQMHGYSLVIVDSSDFVPEKPAYHYRPSEDDPWVREIDTPGSQSSVK